MFSAYANRERLIVAAIVRMAGVGKTTLSQLLLKDQRVKSNFKLKYWIYVSDKSSNVLDLTKKIYAQMTPSNAEITDLDLLQRKVSLKLRAKRFLLVLDDCWSESQFDWDFVKRFSNGGSWKYHSSDNMP